VRRVQSSFFETEAVEHAPDLRLDRVTVAIAKLTIDVMEPVGRRRSIGAFRIQSSPRLWWRVSSSLLHVAEIVEHAHAFGEDRAARKATIRPVKIALRDAFGGAHRAVVERFEAAQES